MERVREAGVGFRSLTEGVDTTTSAGRMVMQMLDGFVEFERSMIRERKRRNTPFIAKRFGRMPETELEQASLRAGEGNCILRSTALGSFLAAAVKRKSPRGELGNYRDH
jgi:Resolvase, N terminal domain